MKRKSELATMLALSAFISITTPTFAGMESTSQTASSLNSYLEQKLIGAEKVREQMKDILNIKGYETTETLYETTDRNLFGVLSLGENKPYGFIPYKYKGGAYMEGKVNIDSSSNGEIDTEISFAELEKNKLVMSKKWMELYGTR